MVLDCLRNARGHEVGVDVEVAKVLEVDACERRGKQVRLDVR